MTLKKHYELLPSDPKARKIVVKDDGLTTGETIPVRRRSTKNGE